MYIIIDENRRKYINAKSSELTKTAIINKSAKTKETVNTNENSYLKNKNIVDIGPIKGPTDISQKDGEKIAYKFRNFGDVSIGYDEKGFVEIYKLANALLKEQSINRSISEEFLVANIFEWLIGTHRNETSKKAFSDYIIEKCEQSITEYNIYFPIVYLEANFTFRIGVTEFLYITEDYIKSLTGKVEEHKKQFYTKSLMEYKGQLVANCAIRAEKGRAINLAKQQVIFSVDILKLCSPTVSFPNIHIFYDVDLRNIHQPNKVLIQVRKEPENIHIEWSRNTVPFVIDKMLWDTMVGTGLGVLDAFAKKTLTSSTELESLIRNAIANFSKAISNHHFHERVVQMFTILESLLLPNDSSPIIDSVSKYLPKLVADDLEERKEIIDTIKRMYKVRSGMVHHAKQMNFEIEDLSLVQRCTAVLILKLVHLAVKNRTKAEVLQEIDDRIHRA